MLESLLHPTAIDPRTGEPLRALGVMPSGRIVWPIAGGAEDDDEGGTGDGGTGTEPADGGTGTDDGGTDDDGGSGDGGKPGGKGKIETLEDALSALTKARQDAAAHRKKVRELEPKAKAHDERTEAEKSERQKAEDRAAAAEKRVADLERESLKAKVAAAKKLPPALAARLQGETQEDLEADADELLESLGDTGGSGAGAGDGDGGTRTPVVKPSLEDASVEEFVDKFHKPRR